MAVQFHLKRQFTPLITTITPFLIYSEIDNKNFDPVHCGKIGILL
jgi:hypothetical protein